MSELESRKISEIQAAEGPPDPELESLIAPQGYAPSLVDEIASLESPRQQRWKGIRFLLYMVGLVAIGFWFCTPSDLIVPANWNEAAPFGLDDRPAVPTNKFLKDVIPRQVGGFKLVDLREERAYEDPYIGAEIVKATYINQAGAPVLVIMSQAESYINARRYLENYQRLLDTQAEVTVWQARLHIDRNYIRWAAPGYANQAYGVAWNNQSHFISVTSPVPDVVETMAAAFPY
jgi:hypothetical protein